jgi:hypothetical protein
MSHPIYYPPYHESLFRQGDFVDLPYDSWLLTSVYQITGWMKWAKRNQLYASICMDWPHTERDMRLAAPVCHHGVEDVPPKIMMHLGMIAQFAYYRAFYDHCGDEQQPTKYRCKKMEQSGWTETYKAPDGTCVQVRLMGCCQSASKTVNKMSRFWFLIDIVPPLKISEVDSDDE